MVFRRKKRQTGEEIGAPAEGRPRLTPVDVQQKVFRLAFRGYNEQDVDRFLDQVTEDLAGLHEENKRLREELDLAGPGGGSEEARRHAEEIIRQAREDAARITAGRGGGDLAPTAYLVRERQFLQRLGRLVQEHASSLKAEARRAREEGRPQQEEGREPEETAGEPAGSEEPERGGGDETAAPVLEETAPMVPPLEPGELSEWSNPFLSEEGTERAEPADRDDQEPSLRELFWGEE